MGRLIIDFSGHLEDLQELTAGAKQLPEHITSMVCWARAGWLRAVGLYPSWPVACAIKRMVLLPVCGLTRVVGTFSADATASFLWLPCP